MSKEDAAAATGRVKVVESLADFKPCHAIIEAVVENLDVKRRCSANSKISWPPIAY
jgi:3-hydroxyacyl-CoA dehydrogenase